MRRAGRRLAKVRIFKHKQRNDLAASGLGMRKRLVIVETQILAPKPNDGSCHQATPTLQAMSNGALLPTTQ